MSTATGLCTIQYNYRESYVIKQTDSTVSEMTESPILQPFFYIAPPLCHFPANHRLTAGELYAINFAPANAKKNSVAKRGDGLYEGNEGLDINKDGKITKNELGQRVKNKSLSVVC